MREPFNYGIYRRPSRKTKPFSERHAQSVQSARFLCEQLEYLLNRHPHRHSTLYAMTVANCLEQLRGVECCRADYQRLKSRWEKQNKPQWQGFWQTLNQYWRSARSITH